MSTAQRHMPPPEFAHAEAAAGRGDPFTMVSGSAQAIEIAQLKDDQEPNFDKHHAAYQEAIRVMQRYGTQAQTVHDGAPEFEPAPTRSPRLVDRPPDPVRTPPPPPPVPRIRTHPSSVPTT